MPFWEIPSARKRFKHLIGMLLHRLRCPLRRKFAPKSFLNKGGITPRHFDVSAARRVVVVCIRLRTAGASPNAQQPSFLFAHLCVRALPRSDYTRENWIST